MIHVGGKTAVKIGKGLHALGLEHSQHLGKHVLVAPQSRGVRLQRGGLRIKKQVVKHIARRLQILLTSKRTAAVLLHLKLTRDPQTPDHLPVGKVDSAGGKPSHLGDSFKATLCGTDTLKGTGKGNARVLVHGLHIGLHTDGLCQYVRIKILVRRGIGCQLRGDHLKVKTEGSRHRRALKLVYQLVNARLRLAYALNVRE